MKNITDNKILLGLPYNYVFFDVDDPAFTVLEVTDHFLAVMGYSRKQIVGKSVFQAFQDHKDSNARLLVPSFKKVLLTKKMDSMQPVRYDIPIQGTDELQLKYWKPENHPYIIDGKVEMIIHTAIDITDLWQAFHK